MTGKLRLPASWFAVTTLSLLLTACYALAGLDMSVEGRHKAWIDDAKASIGENIAHCPPAPKNACHHYRGKDGGFREDYPLSNGNIEAAYSWGNKCRYYFEYDPKTGVIVGFRFEESERFACRISGA